MEVARCRRLTRQGAPRGPCWAEPLDRGKAGSKRSILVDGDGGLLSVVVAGANVNEHKLLRATIGPVVVERPSGRQHLCLDKSYDNGTGEIQSLINGYVPHIRRIGEKSWMAEGERPGRPSLGGREDLRMALEMPWLARPSREEVT